MNRAISHLGTLLVVGLLAACGGAQADEQRERFLIRQSRPTFTPTQPSADPVVLITPESIQVIDVRNNPNPQVPGQTTINSNLPVGLVINSPLVNVRSGPSVDAALIGRVERGAEFTIVARNEAGDWWNACCLNEAPFWVFAELVDTIEDPNGSNNSAPVPIVQNDQPAPVVVQPTPVPPTPVPPTPVPPTSTPLIVQASPGQNAAERFDLRLQEQFPEDNVVRVFLYVYSEAVQALEGYSLRVAKDGVELPVNERSFGPQAGFTWPIAGDRQRFQNLKVEFPGLSPGGLWTAQLIDGNGEPAGPVATFELAGNEPNRELYVRYEQK
ncbi:SH3 domain-containing protein [Chloroflexi bacterium TSY]|nr:SH3 domain-containing protein [Chloroflexi bacterium TSY]